MSLFADVDLVCISTHSTAFGQAFSNWWSKSLLCLGNSFVLHIARGFLHPPSPPQLPSLVSLEEIKEKYVKDLEESSFSYLFCCPRKMSREFLNQVVGVQVKGDSWICAFSRRVQEWFAWGMWTKRCWFPLFLTGADSELETSYSSIKPLLC